jgi:hypothetical protein
MIIAIKVGKFSKSREANISNVDAAVEHSSSCWFASAESWQGGRLVWGLSRCTTQDMKDDHNP